MTDTFRRLFLDHPASVDENYLQHFGVALGYAAVLARASGAALMHALVPGLCKRTASDIILELADQMRTRR